MRTGASTLFEILVLNYLPLGKSRVYYWHGFFLFLSFLSARTLSSVSNSAQPSFSIFAGQKVASNTFHSIIVGISSCMLPSCKGSGNNVSFWARLLIPGRELEHVLSTHLFTSALFSSLAFIFCWVHGGFFDSPFKPTLTRFLSSSKIVLHSCTCPHTSKQLQCGTNIQMVNAFMMLCHLRHPTLPTRD